jgi:ferredoxin
MDERRCPGWRWAFTSGGGRVRITIDLQLCQGHGVCVEEAPEVFRVVAAPGRYDHAELILEDPDESLRRKVEAAVKFCPNRSLKLED